MSNFNMMMMMMMMMLMMMMRMMRTMMMIKLVRRESDARVEKKIKLEDMLETEKR